MSFQTLSPSLTSLIQKYNLDISIVEVNEIEGFSRVDSEFYGKDIMDNERRIKSGSYKLFEEIGTSKGGNAYSSEEFGSGEIRIAKITDVSQQTDISKWEILSNKEYESFSQNILENGDILMSGTHHNPWDLGKVLFIQDLPKNTITTWNQRVFRLKGKEDILKSECLYCLLQSKAIRLQIERYGRGNNQLNLNNEGIESLKIPLPSPIFQSSIASLVQEAHIQRELSKSLYAEAEQILLRELELIDWIPTEVGITEKMSEEVRLFGRCDAEFFQPKYDELFGRLSKFQTQKLGDIVDYQKGVEPGADAYSETGIPFIRVADVSIEGIDSIEKNISPELLEEYGERYSPKKDEILFTKDGTIGISFVVNEDMRAVLSGAFLRLQKKIDIESEYLALVLNSVISKMQIERFSGGAIIAHLKPSDAMELLIPILSLDIQSHISSRIIASHSAREQSKTLLERAKRAVEIFIEEDEASAEIFLNQGTII